MRQARNTPIRAWEAEDSVDIQIGGLLLNTAFRIGGDELKGIRDPDGRTLTEVLRTGMTSIVPNFDARITTAL